MDKEPKNEAPGVELEKSKSHIIVEIIEYMPNSVVIQVRNHDGSVTERDFSIFAFQIIFDKERE